MKKTIMLLGTLSAMYLLGQSGVAPTNKFAITVKSPDASQLSKFIDIPNATSTGTIGVDIPIYTINVDGYTLPIELKNHASGIKVREVATKVGLGWSLSIGGISLSKQIFGADDRGWIPYINPVSFKPNEVEDDNGLAANFTGFNANNPDIPGKKDDTQPDIFSYSIGKFSGEFYLSSTGQVIQVPYNNIKIVLNGVLFEITDDQGITYYFSPSNQTRTLGGSIPTDDDYLLSMTDYKIDKIKFPSGKEINFTYIKTDYYKYISNLTKRYEITKDCQYATTSSIYKEFLSTTEVFDEESIESIKVGNEKVEFAYSGGRQDLNNGLSLDKISVKNGNQQVLAFNLIKDYFNSTEVLANDATTAKRLKLKEVVNLNNGSKYKLIYNEDKSLPNRLSDATDHFGFSNGKNSITGIPFTRFAGKNYGENIDKEQHLDYAISGSLKKIQYPTGGSMEIEYEGDDYYISRQQTTFEPKSATVDEDVAPYYEFSIAGHNIVGSDSNTVTFTSYFSSPVNPDNSAPDLPVKSYFEGQILDTNNNILSNFIFTGSLPVPVPRRDAYRLRIMKVNLRGEPPHINLEDYSATFGLSWTEEITTNTIGNYKTGGLRVKKITKKDENNAVAQSVEYNYNDDQEKSTGNYVGDPVNYIYTAPISADPNSQICQITMIGNNGSFNSSTINGKPIVYDRVQTKFVGNQESYIVADTYSNIRGQNPIVVNPTIFTYFDGKYNLGQIKKKEYFNSSGQIVKSTDFVYENDYYFNKFSNDYNPAEPSLVIKPYSLLINGYHLFIVVGSPYPPSYRAYYNVERYTISSAWVKQKSIISKSYFNNQQQLSERTDYFYDSNYKHLSPIREKVTYSDNSLRETLYAYAHEKNNQLLISKNMIGIPLVNKIQQTTNGITKVMSREETFYPTALPHAVTGNLALPLSEYSNDSLSPTVASKEITYEKYDDKGNILQYREKDGTPVSIVWGYNQTQPIAKVVGSTYSQIEGSIGTIVIKSNEDAADPTKEGELLQALDAFQPIGMVTKYTYDPLVGVTTITPPSGVRELYIYDSSNRLKQIQVRERDNTGTYSYKTVKEFKYNYKP